MDDYDWYTAHKYQSHIPADSRYYTPAQVAAIKQAERRRCAKVCRELDEKYGCWGAAYMCAEAIENLK